MGLRDQIFAVDDLVEEELDIPEWKCKVLIRALAGSERSKLFQQNMRGDGKPDLVKMYPALAIVSARDPETKELIFHPADRDMLNTKSGAALERIAGVAMRLNGFQPEQLKQMEENF